MKSADCILTADLLVSSDAYRYRDSKRAGRIVEPMTKEDC